MVKSHSKESYEIMKLRPLDSSSDGWVAGEVCTTPADSDIVIINTTKNSDLNTIDWDFWYSANWAMESVGRSL